MIPKSKLEEWKKLADSATPGPWEVYNGGWHLGIEAADGSIASVEHCDAFDGKPSAAFIAASREAVPALIEEVERLRETLDDIARLNFAGPNTGERMNLTWAKATKYWRSGE